MIKHDESFMNFFKLNNNAFLTLEEEGLGAENTK